MLIILLTLIPSGLSLSPESVIVPDLNEVFILGIYNVVR